MRKIAQTPSLPAPSPPKSSREDLPCISQLSDAYKVQTELLKHQDVKRGEAAWLSPKSLAEHLRLCSNLIFPSHAKNSTNHQLPTLISQDKALDPVKPRSLISAFSGAVADSEPVTALGAKSPSRALEKLQKESNNYAPAPAPRRKTFKTSHHQGYGTDTYTAPRCKVTSAAISLLLVTSQRSTAQPHPAYDSFLPLDKSQPAKCRQRERERERETNIKQKLASTLLTKGPSVSADESDPNSADTSQQLLCVCLANLEEEKRRQALSCGSPGTTIFPYIPSAPLLQIRGLASLVLPVVSIFLVSSLRVDSPHSTYNRSTK
ncbi:uncharacterized protein BDZ83DRAFT_107485 [Colletotrichum acutatum]|uniref:Uncharacterized protein n=1 Tax=Glomerella acutata TaxID=27357 RepID=A0AAD8UAR8_GLOAC|nr:uncharacterized protein BDZ83DRAFT_107485 [Colletotrichum acutatum]KAK1711939.1 hypothetical protein BDZ83DRAFT_107485 [Colletotrichum acutatum]